MFSFSQIISILFLTTYNLLKNKIRKHHLEALRNTNIFVLKFKVLKIVFSPKEELGIFNKWVKEMFSRLEVSILKIFHLENWSAGKINFKREWLGRL